MDVAYLANMLAMAVKTLGQTVEEATQHMMRAGIPAEPAQQAAALVRERIAGVKKLDEPAAMEDDGLKDWYPGPAGDDVFWPALHSYLLDDRRWPQPVVDSIDRSSTRIVSLLHAPARQRFQSRGLVLGFVQSGKTANFTAVIAKAVDAGYKLVIVLSGLHNGLRNQTQRRLEKELVVLQPRLWHKLTDEERDFRAQGNAAAFLTDAGQQKVLCVMKKNTSRLRAMLRWLRTVPANILAECPTLLVDDEADQASVDTGTEDDPSRINGLIREILDTLPAVSYVAYTATPFANILSDPRPNNSLYPRDFIVSLAEPEDYFGAARIFGAGPGEDEGLDMFRPVEDEEVALLKPAKQKEREDFEPTLAESLALALRWFWMSCAVRLARGQSDQHMSMLTHTTLYTSVHNQFADILDQELRRITAIRAANDAHLLAEMRRQWDEETTRVSAAVMGEQPVSFEEMWRHLPAVLGRTRIIIDNGQSDERLFYAETGGSIQIVVGGNTLSRGLTLEGLTVSYFVRATTMYDTLMQMGRWFGYRRGYSDLPRIWMTDDLLDAFQHIARVEMELREDIDRYEREGITPRDFAPRIQTHSTLAITSPLKMQYAVQCRMSFSGDVKQTFYFRHQDAAWLQSNIQAARDLLRRAHEQRRPDLVWGTHVLYRGIPADLVLEFFSNYQIQEKHADMQPEQLRGYIQEQNRDGQLLEWNVAVVSQKSVAAGTWDGLLPDGKSINLLTRARFGKSEPANIKALMSQPDRAIDLGFQQAPQKQQTPPGSGTFLNWLGALRSPEGEVRPEPARGVRTPLLLLYPIAKDSRPRDTSGLGDRRPLDAAEHIVGLAFVFPRTPRLTPQSYVTADLSRLEEDREIPEPAPEEEA